MRPRYINVRARSANVGSGTGGRSVADPGPACFLADEMVIRGLLPLRFVVGRTRRAGEVLRLSLLDIELRYAFAHCFQSIFERWRLPLIHRNELMLPGADPSDCSNLHDVGSRPLVRAWLCEEVVGQVRALPSRDSTLLLRRISGRQGAFLITRALS